MTKTNSALSNGCHWKGAANEKPQMFAFCLKPRGLEVPNKGSKQRSQRRFPVAGHSYAMLGDQDGYHVYGNFFSLLIILLANYWFPFFKLSKLVFNLI